MLDKPASLREAGLPNRQVYAQLASIFLI